MIHMFRRASKDKGSIYNLITRSYVLLAGIVLILAAAFFTAAFYLVPQYNQFPKIEKLLDHEKELTQEHYSSISADKYLGDNGYFEITDEQADVLYCSNPQKDNVYAKDLLQYLPSVDADAIYFISSMKNEDQPGWLLLRYAGDEDKLTGMAMLDENRKFIYSNMDLKNSQLSETTLEYLYFNEEEDETFIQQYKFQTASGETRFMLIHSDSDAKAAAKAQRRTMTWMLGVFIGAMVVLIIGVGATVSKRVTDPMQRLLDAITEITGGNRVKASESGEEPREIRETIRAFNEMEEALQKSEAEQKKLQDQRRKMVADISHDLKTPVTVIQGYVDAMQDGLIPEEKRQSYLKIIEGKTVLMAELINSFSEYSRLDHPQFQMNMEQGDLCEYIREYIAGEYEELDIAGYELDADIPDEKIYASFDRMQLKRAFENIIVNAVKHTSAGTCIHISISREKERTILLDHQRHISDSADEWMRIEIGDNGPGIPKEYRDTVFEPFVVGDESRTSGKGTGLGLSIAKQIVELHGGAIKLMDKPGTVFLMELPIGVTGGQV